jgi:hypothetical protein
MSRLPISNIDELREEAELAALVRDIARSVTSHPFEKLAVCRDSGPAPKAGWSVLRDGEGNGVAVHVKDVVASDTALAGIVARLRSAQAVSRFLGQDEPSSHLMVEEDALSAEWRLRGVRIGEATVWVGVVGDWQLLPRADELSPGSRTVRIALLASLPAHLQIRAGIDLECSEIRLELAGCGVGATIVNVRGGVMKMRVDDESDEGVAWSPGVRLDLGEIEMAFEDLLGLQPGSELEVEVAHPIRTYLRVGHSQLAVGELDVREGGVVVKIIEVL